MKLWVTRNFKPVVLNSKVNTDIKNILLQKLVKKVTSSIAFSVKGYHQTWMGTLLICTFSSLKYKANLALAYLEAGEMF